VKVRQIPDDFLFVSDSQEVDQLNAKFGQDFDSYFVRVGSGDYTDVIGMRGIVPRTYKRVFVLKATDPRAKII
jgi:hypothetical protein